MSIAVTSPPQALTPPLSHSLSLRQWLQGNHIRQDHIQERRMGYVARREHISPWHTRITTRVGASRVLFYHLTRFYLEKRSRSTSSSLLHQLVKLPVSVAITKSKTSSGLVRQLRTKLSPLGNKDSTPPSSPQTVPSTARVNKTIPVSVTMLNSGCGHVERRKHLSTGENPTTENPGGYLVSWFRLTCSLVNR